MGAGMPSNVTVTPPSEVGRAPVAGSRLVLTVAGVGPRFTPYMDTSSPGATPEPFELAASTRLAAVKNGLGGTMRMPPASSAVSGPLAMNSVMADPQTEACATADPQAEASMVKRSGERPLAAVMLVSNFSVPGRMAAGPASRRFCSVMEPSKPGPTTMKSSDFPASTTGLAKRTEPDASTNLPASAPMERADAPPATATAAVTVAPPSTRNIVPASGPLTAALKDVSIWAAGIPYIAAG